MRRWRARIRHAATVCRTRQAAHRPPGGGSGRARIGLWVRNRGGPFTYGSDDPLWVVHQHPTNSADGSGDGGAGGGGEGVWGLGEPSNGTLRWAATRNDLVGCDAWL